MQHFKLLFMLDDGFHIDLDTRNLDSRTSSFSRSFPCSTINTATKRTLTERSASVKMSRHRDQDLAYIRLSAKADPKYSFFQLIHLDLQSKYLTALFS